MSSKCVLKKNNKNTNPNLNLTTTTQLLTVTGIRTGIRAGGGSYKELVHAVSDDLCRWFLYGGAVIVDGLTEDFWTCGRFGSVVEAFISFFVYLLARTTFSSLHFYAILTLVPNFFFHCFLSLSWKTRLVFVLAVTLNTEIEHVANGRIPELTTQN